MLLSPGWVQSGLSDIHWSEMVFAAASFAVFWWGLLGRPVMRTVVGRTGMSGSLLAFVQVLGLW